MQVIASPFGLTHGAGDANDSETMKFLIALTLLIVFIIVALGVLVWSVGRHWRRWCGAHSGPRRMTLDLAA